MAADIKDACIIRETISAIYAGSGANKPIKADSQIVVDETGWS